MNIKLRDYQEDLYNGIVSEMSKGKRKILAQLETGGGKSVVIAYLADKLEGRTLILTHRAEILEQNAEWIKGVGILRAKKNTVGISTRVVVAMVQTLHARIKRYGVEYIGHFDNIILDEVHIQIFEKVFKKYYCRYIIGFTATPILNKKETVKINDIEYIKTHTLSETFDTIVVGISISELIERDYLVQDFNISLELPNIDKLKDSISTPDGYTFASLNEVYSNKASIKVLTEAIETYCKGKKTLIFNATTKTNLFVYEALKSLNLNVKLFDSVNSSASERDGIIDWFRNERSAILIGTNVFTTGFNVTDIEVIIVNRATKSLGLWIQMVGRGSRPTDKILKDHFTCIDLGQNIERHAIWSSSRDWKALFEPVPLKLKRARNLIETWACNYCGGLTPSGEVLKEDGKLYCYSCGSQKSTTENQGSDKKDKDGNLVEVDRIPLPSGSRILKYAKLHNGDETFAFRVLEERIMSLFTHYRVEKEAYIEREQDYRNRVESIYRPIYFVIIKSDLIGKNRRYKTQLGRMFKKIERYYQIIRDE